MTDFSGFGLPPALMDMLGRMGYTTPTPIQIAALPPAIAGRDVLGSAQTGTGKTAAFALPLLMKLTNNPRGSALILTPTRELATQVMTVLRQMLGTRSTIQTALLIGGESMGPQFLQLKNRPRLIVGTPGRVNDHLERGTLMLHDAGFLVLDETDRMLDMGFSAQLDRIAKFLPKARQTLMFSATLPHNILKLSEKYLTNPVRVNAGEESTPLTSLTQQIIHTGSDNKFELLLKELHARTGSIIIFVKTKRGADRLAQKLNQRRLNADAIHGDLKQSQRDRVILAFRNQKHRIMVATDVAARGLDIPHIEHVINYDLPHAPEDFIHRIGRTARNGAEGDAVSLISPDDADKWRAIQRLLNPGAPEAHRERGAREHRGRSGGHPASAHPASSSPRPRRRRGGRRHARPGGFAGERAASPS